MCDGGVPVPGNPRVGPQARGAIADQQASHVPKLPNPRDQLPKAVTPDGDELAETATRLGHGRPKLWRQIATDAADQGIELTSQVLVWLRQAGKLADTIALMEATLEGAELVVLGYMNKGLVANPLLSELRMHRQLLAQTVARVDLDVAEEAAPVVGGNNRFRSAAMSRWHGSGA